MTAFPVILESHDVADLDATRNSVSIDVDVRQGVRYAIGVVVPTTDDGDTVDITANGTLIQRVLDKDQLANLAASNFEDGVIWTADTTGTVTITVATNVTNAFDIQGVIIREPDEQSGVVEDQGTGTHCDEWAIVYDGDLYVAHAEMYTGAIWLSINQRPKGKLFDGISADYNEKYHNGICLVATSAGVAAVRVGHNQNQIDVKYMPSGLFNQLSSNYQITGTGSTFTYCMARALADDRIAILTRGSSESNGKDCTIVMVSDVDQIDAAGTTHTFDFVVNVGRSYPRSFSYHVDGGGLEVLCCMIQEGNPDWGDVWGFLFAPNLGTHGEFYALDGVAATNNAALGTEASPRFPAAQKNDATDGGSGIRLLSGNGINQRYTPAGSAHWDVTTYPASGVAPTADVLFPFIDNSEDDSNSYGTVDVRWAIFDAGVRSVSAGDFTGPNLATGNSYRLAILAWTNAAGDRLLVITDRGTRAATDKFGDAVDLYYDWGSARQAKIVKVTNAFAAASISFELVNAVHLPAGITHGWFTGVGDTAILYQRAINELHPTHRQSKLELLYGELPESDPLFTTSQLDLIMDKINGNSTQQTLQTNASNGATSAAAAKTAAESADTKLSSVPRAASSLTPGGDVTRTKQSESDTELVERLS